METTSTISIGRGILDFITNPILLACITSWLGAQFIKASIKLFSGKVHSFGELVELMFWRTGGMPSSHSAVCCALCTVVCGRNGSGSDIFAFSMVFLFVTIRDAFGVRRSSGLQASKINEIGTELKEKNILDNYKKVKETRGHSPMEVLMGCVFGLLVGLAFVLIK